MEIITFDAKAEFTGFELSTLPEDAKLVVPSNDNAGPLVANSTPEQARLAVAIAEKALMLAELQPG